MTKLTQTLDAFALRLREANPVAVFVCALFFALILLILAPTILALVATAAIAGAASALLLVLVLIVYVLYRTVRPRILALTEAPHS